MRVFIFALFCSQLAVGQDCSEEIGRWTGEGAITTLPTVDSSTCCILCHDIGTCRQWQFGDSKCMMFDGSANPARTQTFVRGGFSDESSGGSDEGNNETVGDRDDDGVDSGDGGDGGDRSDREGEFVINWQKDGFDRVINVQVGDVLVFEYFPNHNVWQFNNRDAYDDCRFSSSDASEVGGRRDSPLRFIIEEKRIHYFGSEATGDCIDDGLKLGVRVDDADRSDGDGRSDDSSDPGRVGDGFVWSLTWDDDRTYNRLTVDAGDEVRFTFTTSHNVYLFDDKGDWDNCDFDDADRVSANFASTYTFLTRINDEGDSFYFACDESDDCEDGQKIEIRVKDDSVDDEFEEHRITWDDREYDPLVVNAGDTIRFTFDFDHDLWLMDDDDDFDDCDFDDAELLAQPGGSPFVFITSSGDRGETFYFACDESDHCDDDDQKLEVRVRGDNDGDFDVHEITWEVRHYDPLNINPGDSVRFEFDSDSDVYLMEDKDDWDDCDFDDAERMADDDESPYTFTTSAADRGETFYFASKEDDGCEDGQKIEIVVRGDDDDSSSDSDDFETHEIRWEIRNYEPLIVDAGDHVKFEFSDTHNLHLMEDEDDFVDCDFDDAEELADNDQSPYTFVTNLADAGESFFFSCDEDDDDHCEDGQKIEIQVRDPGDDIDQDSTADDDNDEFTEHEITWEIRDYDELSVSAGDHVKFEFSSVHDLWLMDDEDDWDDCDFDDAEKLASGDEESSYTFVIGLSDEGEEFYFACGTEDHCDRGMKIEVRVDGESQTPSPSPSPSPSS